MSQLLISFCNARPQGLALGRFCFDTGDFAWVETDGTFLGATGLCAFGEGCYCLAQRPEGRTSLAVLDRGFRLLASTPLERVLDGHSMALDGDALLVTSTATDEVIRVRWDGGSCISEETVWAASSAGSDTVHVNSIAMIDGRPHISCFGPKSDSSWSSTSNGQVIDISAGEPVCGGLLHPHTLFVWEGRPHILDSRTGGVLEIDTRTRTARERWRVSGYVRGAAAAGGFLYIAASAYRQKSKSTGVLRAGPPGVETRCLLHRVDTVAGEVQTRDLTPFGLEIYDLACTPEIPFQSGREDAMALRLRRYDAAALERVQELEESLHLRILYDAELHRLVNEDHNFSAAAFALERLLAQDPSNADWQYHYGFCLLYLNAPERALIHLEKALSLGYHEFWVRYNLVAGYLKTGAIDAAREEYARAVALKPEGVDVSALGAAIESVSQAHV